jgi:MoaA/NifB/PqqE/SkfB family radical SAM enzyme
MKQQLYVVKSSLGAVNYTLSDLEYNERLLQVGIRHITGHMDALKTETQKLADIFGAKVEVEGHI